MTALSIRAATRLIVRHGIEEALLPLGFSKARPPMTWVRQADGVSHLVGVLHQWQQRHIQWGVGCPPVAQIVWDRVPDPDDVAYAAIIGTPAGIRHPAPGGAWRIEGPLPEEEVRAIALAVRDGLATVATRLGEFRNKRDAWLYLMENRDPVDRRDFAFPAMLPVKVLTAAALALTDNDSSGCELVVEAEGHLAKFRDALNKRRLARLRDLARQLCP